LALGIIAYIVIFYTENAFLRQFEGPANQF